MKSSELLEHYEDQRRYPRIPYPVPVSIEYNKNLTIEAVIHDISPDGIQFRCDEASAIKLIPESGHIEQASRPKITTIFEIRNTEPPKSFQAEAEICYALFLDDCDDTRGKVAFGAAFTKVKRKSEKLLHGFLFKQNRSV